MALKKSALTPARPTQAQERAFERNCVGLAEQLNDERVEARRWAARDLVECKDCSVVLLARLQIENHKSVREVILTTLTLLGDSVAVSGLVQCMRSEDAELRNEAIEAMKQLPSEVAPIMRSLLADADSDLRIFAVNILESLRHPDVLTWLHEVIEHDVHVNVCATAVDLLGEVGNQATLEPLRRLKTRFDKEPYIQFAADLAVKRIQGS